MKNFILLFICLLLIGSNQIQAQTENCRVLYIGSLGNTFPALWTPSGYTVDKVSVSYPNGSAPILSANLDLYDMVWVNIQNPFTISATAEAKLKSFLDDGKGVYFVGEPTLGGRLPLGIINNWVLPANGGGNLLYVNRRIGAATNIINNNVLDNLDTNPNILTSNITLNGFGWVSGVVNNDNVVCNFGTNVTGVAFNASDLVGGKGRLACIFDSNVFSGATSGTNNGNFCINMMQFLTNHSYPGICVKQVLPIELLNFEAQLNENQTVDLIWQTATEINNDFFTVQKSTDGIDWEEVGQVDGAGNSNFNLSYSLVDYYPSFGTSYYRLKQTDFDSEISYSPIRALVINNPSEGEISAYPTPTTDYTHILNHGAEVNVIKVYNRIGQDVTNMVEIINTNESKVTLRLSNLNQGLYYIKLNNLSPFKIIKT